MNTHTPLHEKHERFPIIKECIPNNLIDLTFIYMLYYFAGLNEYSTADHYPISFSINIPKGMRRPTGSYFWDADLKRSIIIKPFSRTGYNFSNARKLENIIGDFNSRTGY